MLDLTLQRALFGFSCALTTHTPRAGARLLNATVKPMVSNAVLRAAFLRRNQAVLDRVGEPRRVLVLSDIHLGDALITQGLIAAVRDFFPSAEIHYAVSRSSAALIEGHPDVTRLWPVYTGSLLPSGQDVSAVRDLMSATRCDLIVSACPSFARGNPLPRDGAVLDFVTHAPVLVRNEDAPTEPNHFLFQGHRFLAGLFSQRWSPRRTDAVGGARIYFDDDAVDAADAYLESAQASHRSPWVFLNPDGASPYTRPPEAVWRQALERVIQGGATVFIGEGHTDAGVGVRLYDRLPLPLRDRTRVVPASTPVPAYAAMLDRMDAFVSGDTGPLHWGAARKISRTGRRAFRNRTAIFSLFGATPARMSGYDSGRPGFLPAWQDAPSEAHVSHAPCQNITCLNKLLKTCAPARCFEGSSPLALADAILRSVQTAGSARPAQSGPAGRAVTEG